MPVEERFWTHRLRWRMRGGTWLWPAFVAAIVVDAAILHFLPPVGPDQQLSAPAGLNLLGDVIVAGFANLFLVAAVAPWLARRLAARDALAGQPAPPYEVHLSRTASILMAVGALGMIVVGFGNRPVIVSDTNATEAAARTLRAYATEHGSPALQSNVAEGIANTRRLSEGFFRTCVPDPSVKHVSCFFIDTKKDPPTIRFDPDRTPNKGL